MRPWHTPAPGRPALPRDAAHRSADLTTTSACSLRAASRPSVSVALSVLPVQTRRLDLAWESWEV